MRIMYKSLQEKVTPSEESLAIINPCYCLKVTRILNLAVSLVRFSTYADTRDVNQTWADPLCLISQLWTSN